jgi:hypothetical protein
MTVTVGEILLILAGVALVVLIIKGMTIFDALIRFTEWTGKKWKEQEEKNRRADDKNPPTANS